jgi:hypothetical protein
MLNDGSMTQVRMLVFKLSSGAIQNNPFVMFMFVCLYLGYSTNLEHLGGVV